MKQATPTLDTAQIRTRARRHLEEGAVTQNYRADREAVVAMLNAALATEIVCQLRYKRHHFNAHELASEAVANEFLTHAHEEEQHADWLTARIMQIGGEPDFSPQHLDRRSHAEYVPGRTLVEMIQEDLVAERIAIERYGEMIRRLGDRDITTRRLLEKILAVEEEHAEDLVSLVQGTRPAAGCDNRHPDGCA